MPTADLPKAPGVCQFVGNATAGPVDVRFGVSCEDVTPSRAQIASIGPLGYDTVKVACSREVKNERERQYLELFAGQGSVRYSFQVPHRPGSLVLVASDDRVVGLGFTTLTLTLSQLEEDGSPLLAEEARTLQLTTSGGDIDVAAISIEKGASEASVSVRIDRGVKVPDHRGFRLLWRA